MVNFESYLICALGFAPAVRGLIAVREYTASTMKRTRTHTPPPDVPKAGDARIVERPDGFYWRSEDGLKEYGPFDSRLAAVADMETGGETDYEPGESIEEAEAEVGMADWIDPETGEPAEESVPRIEDH
jgi:hypothetical protein